MNYETLQLSEINIPSLKLVKEVVIWLGDQDHSRWIFRCPRNHPLAGKKDLYVKIWNPTYVRRDNILRGIDAHFYGERTTPALKALIFHNGICRGYVMHRCRQNRRLDAEFYELIKEKTVSTGYFHYQFSRYHMMKYERTYSLIDLEGIYPIKYLPKMSIYYCRFDYLDYERFVTALYNDTLPSSSVHHRALPCHPETQPQPANLLVQVSQLLYWKSQAIYKLMRRWMVTKWGTIMNHTHLIEG